MTVETAVTLLIEVLAAHAMVMTALAAGSVATSATMTGMGIVQSLAHDMDILDCLSSSSTQAMLLALMHTGSLAAILDLMQHVNLIMIMIAL